MKTIPSKTLPSDEEIPAPPKENKYYELKIPRLSFKDTPINSYLVIALVIFAFLLGMLTNKVAFLEDSLKTGTPKNAPAGNNDNVLAAENPPPPPPPPGQKVDVDLGTLPIQGSEDAKVTIVEFSDLQCPFCKQFVDSTYPQLYDTYIKTGQVKFAFRHYPLTSIHPNAQKAGEAAECANEQDSFWEYHDLLFKNQDAWSNLTAAGAAESFTTYAGELGLDSGQFSDCLSTGKYAQKVTDDTSAGTQAGVDGTPAFFVNGSLITGAQPFSEFQRLIDAELNN
jgi:protein-disulfide isomerase